MHASLVGLFQALEEPAAANSVTLDVSQDRPRAVSGNRNVARRAVQAVRAEPGLGAL